MTFASARRLFPGGWFLIEEKDLASDTSTVEFSGIPASFAELRIVAAIRSTRADAGGDEMNMQFATGGGALDTGSNYDSFSQRTHATDLSSVTRRTGDTSAQAARFWIPTDHLAAEVYGTWECTFPQYANSAIYKTFSAWGGYASGGTGDDDVSHGWAVGSWRNTGAVTSIGLFVTNGDVKAGSVLRLYGVG